MSGTVQAVQRYRPRDRHAAAAFVQVPVALCFGREGMGCLEKLPTRSTFAGIEMELSLPILHDEVPGDISILKGQVTDVIDEKQKFGWEVPDLLGEIIMRTGL